MAGFVFKARPTTVEPPRVVIPRVLVVIIYLIGGAMEHTVS